ncbi:hypothetical protein BJ912DRAFT_1148572 [Pholiota molesta]|nr:hypothetical protein BJ912DRAFT_1148572 [Pholiota molesta]
MTRTHHGESQKGIKEYGTTWVPCTQNTYMALSNLWLAFHSQTIYRSGESRSPIDGSVWVKIKDEKSSETLSQDFSSSCGRWKGPDRGERAAAPAGVAVENSTWTTRCKSSLSPANLSSRARRVMRERGPLAMLSLSGSSSDALQSSKPPHAHVASTRNSGLFHSRLSLTRTAAITTPSASRYAFTRNPACTEQDR